MIFSTFSSEEKCMRKFFIFLIVGALAACASSGLAYKPAHWKGPNWAITGKADVDEDGDTVTILINGTEVMSGYMTGDTPTDILSGNYQDYATSARCTAENAGTSKAKHECMVEVDGKIAGQLSF
jgi:hypothetical protein